MRGFILKSGLKEELKCYEYINAIRDIEELPIGLYRADRFREELHNELCELFGLSKEITKKYTDNLDLSDEKVAEKLYFSLLAEKNKNLL